MPCLQSVLEQEIREPPLGERQEKEPIPRTDSHAGRHGPAQADQQPYPIIEVGKARFLIRTQDPALVEELRYFSRTLDGSPRPEIRFTNLLFACTGQGRLEPWGWQRQPGMQG